MAQKACPELAVALSPFGYAQGKFRRRGSRMGGNLRCSLRKEVMANHRQIVKLILGRYKQFTICNF